MEGVVGGGEHLGFVDVVDVDGLQHLRFHEMPDAALRHDGDGHGLLDPFDHLRVAHAGHAARRADVGGNALERHDGAGSGLFGDVRLLGCGDVHDDAALEHLGELAIQGNALLRGLRF